MFGEVVEVAGLASNPRLKKEPGYTIDETIGVTFIFESGMLGTHTHTWVGDAWRNELNFSGEKRHYRVDMWEGTITVLEGNERRIIKTSEKGMYSYENELFLDMVKSGDWSGNICTYGDGLKTLEMTLAANESVEKSK